MRNFIANNKEWLRVGGIALASALMAVMLYSWVAPKPARSFRDLQSEGPLARFVASAPEGMADFTQPAEIALPAVVHIRATNGEQTAQRGNRQRDDDNDNDNEGNPFRDFFRFNDPDFGRGPGIKAGSGVILSADGYIVTNNHVVDGMEKYQVVLNDNRSYTAKLIGTDPSTDLALLKIEEKGLSFLKLGNSDNVRVGEWVLAVGNPLNLTNTVTAGIVSAKGRNININRDRYRIESFIQTDAAVNSGNSGGALVNMKGELIGINTAIASPTGGYAGYSFAIPVNLMTKVVDDLMNYGEVQRGLLGISIGDVSAELAEERKLSVNRGVFVESVNEGSAAKEGGIEANDVIIKVGDASVKNAAELQEQIGRHRPGDKVNLTVMRGSSEKVFTVTLKNKAGTTAVVKRAETTSSRMLGANLRNLTADEKRQAKVEGGVRIESLLPGKLRSQGVREGFIITRISDQEVNSVEDVNRIIEKRIAEKRSGAMIEGVYPDGKTAVYAISF